MLLELNNIKQSFRGEIILDNINISITDKDYLCIIGESGCGKTTLLNIISGMLKPDSGEILLDNNQVKDFDRVRNSIIGYLPCGNSMIQSLNIYDNIKCATNLYHKSDIDIDLILDRLKISKIKNAYPSEISSGEYKRACFARVIALDTNFLLLDEPTSNLDKDSSDIIINMIDEMSSNKGIVIATHDNKLIRDVILKL